MFVSPLLVSDAGRGSTRVELVPNHSRFALELTRNNQLEEAHVGDSARVMRANHSLETAQMHDELEGSTLRERKAVVVRCHATSIGYGYDNASP